MRIPVLGIVALLIVQIAPVPALDVPNPSADILGKLISFLKQLPHFIIFFPDDKQYLPSAVSITEISPNSEIVQDLKFHAKVTHTSSCRTSMENWDCPECKRLIPDGIALSSFDSRKFAVFGAIVKSDANKAIYIQVQGASSIPNKIESLVTSLIEHPNLPKAYVKMGIWLAFNEVRQLIYNTVSDQLKLHPKYKVHVVGHSFGGAVGSLITVDLFSRIPQLNSNNLVAYLYGKPRVGDANYAKFVQDEGIDIRRIVYQWDEAPHNPPSVDGFVHEGVEYWQYDDDFNTKQCIGPKGLPEVRDCSNTAIAVSDTQHLNYYGVYLGCQTDHD